MLLPLSAFITTTPNGFAIILAIVAVLACISTTDGTTPRIIPLLFATWSALTHPLIGLPIFCAVVADTIVKSRVMSHELQDSESKTTTSKNSATGIQPLRILALLLAAFSGFTVPIIFGLSSAMGSQGVNFAAGKLGDVNAWIALATPWIPFVANHFALWPDASAWIEKLIPLLILFFAIGGTIQRYREQHTIEPWLIAAASAAAAASLLQIAGDFGFLIDYERGNYAARLWIVSAILLLPAAIPWWSRFLDRAKRAAPASSIAILFAIGILGAGSAYAALPRQDAVSSNRGWSVGITDINAVKLIDEDSADTPYTVLANQSVSAAAVKTFGFKRYHNDIFFYPIPTGGALYDLFLTASYGNPSRDTMTKAAALGGSELVYFVVNDYWWKSDELIETAKASADRVFDIGNGKVTVFKYEIKN